MKPVSKLTALSTIWIFTLAGQSSAAYFYGGAVTDPATWNSSTNGKVGDDGTGWMTINGGSSLTGKLIFVASGDLGSVGTLSVDGSGSTMTGAGSSLNTSVYVGYTGTGIMNVTNGGKVTGYGVGIGWTATGAGTVNVVGAGSLLEVTHNVTVGNGGTGLLEVGDGGMVKGDVSANVGSSMRLFSGGQHAIYTETLVPMSTYLNRVDSGTAAEPVQYWNGSGWDSIANATEGTDYTLTLVPFDTRNYTVLTVLTPAPEPSVVGLLALATGAAFGMRRRRK